MAVKVFLEYISLFVFSKPQKLLSCYRGSCWSCGRCKRVEMFRVLTYVCVLAVGMRIEAQGWIQALDLLNPFSTASCIPGWVLFLAAAWVLIHVSYNSPPSNTVWPNASRTVSPSTPCQMPSSFLLASSYLRSAIIQIADVVSLVW